LLVQGQQKLKSTASRSSGIQMPFYGAQGRREIEFESDSSGAEVVWYE
jgi:hypothetical protein